VTALAELGWGPFFSSQVDLEAEAALLPARVSADHGAGLLVTGEGGERPAVLPASVRARGAPAVGDWVLVEQEPGGAVVRRCLARRSALVRGAAGRRTEDQVLAANVDVVFVVQAAGGDLNPRRLERTLAAVHASGAAPVVIMGKADLLEDPAAEAERLAPHLGGAPLLVLSARTGDGVEAVLAHLGPGLTGALVGSSGVGKSTLVNRLVGSELQATGEVRARDGRGQHVTVARRLVMLPGGGLLLDGPGLRELQLAGGEGLAEAFAEVVALAAGCRFGDCRHEAEPGCAVLAAVADGRLEEARLLSFRRLEAEARARALRSDSAARAEETRRWRLVAREQRRFKKLRGR
jgi:ribosome biogenesis GTPase